MKQTLMHRLALGTLIGLVLSCSGSGDFGAAVGVGGWREASNDRGRQQDDEDEKADEPAQVAGAFLSCAFYDKKDEVIARTTSDPEGSLEIGCGLYRFSNKMLIDSRGLEYHWQLVMQDEGYKPIESRQLPLGADFHSVVTVPVRYLAGTLIADVADGEGRRSARLRSIPTITAFGARNSFNIFDDIGALGNVAAGVETLNGGATSASPTGDDKWWWLQVAGFIIEKFGEAAARPATNNTGTEVYMPKVTASATTINYGGRSSGGSASQSSSGGSQYGSSRAGSPYYYGDGLQYVQARPTSGSYPSSQGGYNSSRPSTVSASGVRYDQPSSRSSRGSNYGSSPAGGASSYGSGKGSSSSSGGGGYGSSSSAGGSGYGGAKGGSSSAYGSSSPAGNGSSSAGGSSGGIKGGWSGSSLDGSKGGASGSGFGASSGGNGSGQGRP